MPQAPKLPWTPPAPDAGASPMPSFQDLLGGALGRQTPQVPEAPALPQPAAEPEQWHGAEPVGWPEAEPVPWPEAQPEADPAGWPEPEPEPAAAGWPEAPPEPDAVRWPSPGPEATPEPSRWLRTESSPAALPWSEVAPDPAPDLAPVPTETPAAARRRPSLPRLRLPALVSGRLGVPRILDHRLTLVGVTAVALLAGVGAGAVHGLIAAPPPAAPASPEQCAAAQVAWTESASSQVAMSADKPVTLRTGFLGASAALDHVTPPPAVAADWKTVKTYVDAVAKAVDPVDPLDDAGITTAVGAAISRLDTAATTAASARVTAYLQAGCVS